MAYVLHTPNYEAQDYTHRPNINYNYVLLSAIASGRMDPSLFPPTKREKGLAKVTFDH